jgi:hypothetical protein
MATSAERRLSALEKEVGSRAERTIVVKVPTLLTPIEGSVETTSTITPETERALDEMLHAIGVTDADTVIEIAHFYPASTTNGHTEPSPIPTLRLVSVTGKGYYQWTTEEAADIPLKGE